jgi:hypothetical protein
MNRPDVTAHESATSCSSKYIAGQCPSFPQERFPSDRIPPEAFTYRSNTQANAFQISLAIENRRAGKPQDTFFVDSWSKRNSGR